MEWSVDLSGENRSKRVTVVLTAVVVALVAVVLFRQPLLAVIGVVAIAAATLEVFLPIKFRLDAEGAHRKIGLSESVIAWPAVKRLVEDEVGIHLSPFEEANRMDAFRGVYLRTPSNRAEVLVKIAELRDEYGRNLV